MSADRVAIAYSSAHPYVSLLTHELAEADIGWHGPSDTSLDSTALARSLSVILEMADVVRSGGPAVNRAQLIRWLSIGHVFLDGELVASGRLKSLIRSNGLFGDASNWRDHLQALAVNSPTEDELVDDDDDQQRARARSRLANAQSAALLVRLIDQLTEVVSAVAAARSYQDLAARSWSALSQFHLCGRWWQGDPAERQACQRITELLNDEVPALDSFTELGSDPAELGILLTRDLAGRRGRHGQSGTGIHVGSLTSMTGLVFDQVVIVGAAEGMLPPVAHEDPLLPDDARAMLRGRPDDLRLATDLSVRHGRAYASALTPGGESAVTWPRGALPGGAVGQPSRFLPAHSGKTEDQRVRSRRAAFADGMPRPATDTDLAVRTVMCSGELMAAQQAKPTAVAQMVALRPEFGIHFGDLSAPAVAAAVWNVQLRPLSATAIEAFIHCPYHFFVQRVLGINTDEVVDEIDVIAPRDFGTLLHTALEEFVNAARTEGWLPDAGQPW
ncbi:MAG: PD-(D/E)XK nuclease family protein, partial [Actinomycetes bacterium]